MESRDFVYLQEAYQQMYQLDEEVEIATEYFYEMGLNEYGVNALIEELGVEEFVEWVYDIAESYTLTEARAGGSRIEPVTKSGKAIGSLKGGAKSAAINRLRKEKAARRESEERASAERPSGMKAAFRSQAMKAAAKSQPKAKKEVPSETKKGIAGAIEYAKKRAAADTELLRKGMRNLATSPAARGAATAAAALRAGGEFAHRAGQKAAETETGKKVKKTLGKAALAAAGAAGAGAGSLKAGKSPAAAAGRAVGTFLRKMRAEDREYILDHLLSEGYAETPESAQAIMKSMSEEWAMDILES